MALGSPQLVCIAQKDESEQIHLALAGADGMTVSWVTCTPLGLSQLMSESSSPQLADLIW